MKTPLIEEGARAARAAGAECVVVLGLGFVGTAVAANLSRTRGKGGEPLFFVIGLDLDAARAARLDEGRAPTYANDPSLEQVIAAACRERRSRNIAHTITANIAIAVTSSSACEALPARSCSLRANG